MYDDDLFSMMNSYTTTQTENETEKETQSPQYNSFTQIKSPYIDDYSAAQNFEEERSYNGSQTVQEFESETKQVQKMHAPTIQKQEAAVKLTKTKEKLYFSARLKLAATVFAIIFAALVFATAWNFAQANSLNSGLSSQRYEISQLTNSINNLTIEYNKLSNQNSADGYVGKVEGVNSFTVSLDEFYVEPEIEKLPSNWFNDVCEFFSSLFAA